MVDSAAGVPASLPCRADCRNRLCGDERCARNQPTSSEHPHLADPLTRGRTGSGSAELTTTRSTSGFPTRTVRTTVVARRRACTRRAAVARSRARPYDAAAVDRLDAVVLREAPGEAARRDRRSAGPRVGEPSTEAVMRTPSPLHGRDLRPAGIVRMPRLGADQRQRADQVVGRGQRAAAGDRRRRAGRPRPDERIARAPPSGGSSCRARSRRDPAGRARAGSRSASSVRPSSVPSRSSARRTARSSRGRRTRRGRWRRRWRSGRAPRSRGRAPSASRPRAGSSSTRRPGRRQWRHRDDVGEPRVLERDEHGHQLGACSRGARGTSRRARCENDRVRAATHDVGRRDDRRGRRDGGGATSRQGDAASARRPRRITPES